MAVNYAQHVSTRQTPQSEPIPGKPMVQNSAGGYAFAVDDWTRLQRFLVLGCDSGTYYASERQLTKENAACVLRCADLDFGRTLATVVGVSVKGRAPKNDAAIFALALLSSRGKPKQDAEALGQLNAVCRIGTHLFQFMEAIKHLRGRGRSLHRAMQQWYLGRNLKDLCHQVAKYQQRGGWSHRDVLRLCKPNPGDVTRSEIFRWALGKQPGQEGDFVHLPDDAMGLIYATELLKRSTDIAIVERVVSDYQVPRECVPTEWLNEPRVWEAMLPSMPATAMLRNLGKMSEVGLLRPMSKASQHVCLRFGDSEWIRKSRLHPFTILLGLSTYRSGHGVKGSLSWLVDTQVCDALNAAYYSAFDNVEPTGKRYYLGIDVSGSMDGSTIAGTHLSARDGAAAMAMLTVKLEPLTYSAGFSHELVPLPLSKSDSLADVVTKTRWIRMGRTDCAQPMLDALQKRVEADVFIIYTDNETWAGKVHPCQALRKYREQTGVAAKLIVVGMTATEFSIADQSDAGMLDVVGFDAATPQVMADFVRGS